MEDTPLMSESSVRVVDAPDLFEFLEARVGTVLRGAAQLSERLLLMVFHTRIYEGWESELTFYQDGSDRPLLTRSARFPCTDTDEWQGRVLLVHLQDSDADEVGVRVHVQSWRRSLSIEANQVRDRLVGIRALLRNELASLDATVRDELIRLVSTSSEWEPNGQAASPLFGALRQVRDALREPRHLAVQRRDAGLGLSVDSVLALDERAFWIKGWARDADGTADWLRAVAPEGVAVDLLPGAHRYDRPDVRAAYGIPQASSEERAGFLSYVELPAPSRLDAGWLCELSDSRGGAVEAHAPDVIRDPVEVRNRVLSELDLCDADADFLARNHLHPAIARFRAAEMASAGVTEVGAFGSVPRDPVVSLIIPVFRRLDLLEHQFSQFVHDPGLTDTELYFILDSPEQQDAVERKLRELHQLYGVSCRYGVTNRNLGLSGASNLAAEQSRGRILLFLHSDVVPSRSGWIDDLRARYEATPQVGALGPQLRFENGTVQSAGMFFREADDGSGWEAAHLLRGLHGGLELAQASRTVPAVSSACMMVGRDRFESVDGFRTDFVHGGYEDADLCLRLAAAGYENWYAGSVPLYHLEGRSFPESLRTLTGDYNRWLHRRFWGAEMRGLAEQFPVRGIAPVDRPEGAS